MSNNQAISRRSFTTSITFLEKPSEETRKALIADGFQFDGKSKQWYRRQEESSVVSEEEVAQHLAA
ncbi:hypothetical protein [Zavarzinella formosa]|uniref:hypothetical protein n=1 Tax=Zavarzinella formosa TaxID=360055 RepID=UPI0002E2C310|nr:hypothetical protein [Zavarzinella formosa]